MRPKKIIASGKEKFSSPQAKGLLVSIAVLVVLGIGVSGYALWQNLGANAGTTSTLGRGWTTLGQISTNGLGYSAAASVCKIADPTVATGADLEGRIQITAGTTDTTISAGVFDSTGATWASGTSITAAVGNESVTALTSSLDPTATVGVILYGPDYTTISNTVRVSDMQFCS